MPIAFNQATLKLLDGRNYAVLATVNADGGPQTSVVWVGRDGADLLFSTVEGRVKHRNMVRDPRVSVTVIDSADPENYVELRGRVTLTPDIGAGSKPSFPGSTTAGTPAQTGLEPSGSWYG